MQNFNLSSLGLNTSANMPACAAGTFPVISGLTVNRQGVNNLEVNNASFFDDDCEASVITGSLQRERRKRSAGY